MRGPGLELERGGQLAHERLEATLALVAARGYTLTPEGLGGVMLGGPVDGDAVRAALLHLGLPLDPHGLVQVPGLDQAESHRRQQGHAQASGGAWDEAERYVRRLVATCPWTECVLVAGSLASGGYAAEDDVDLDLVVADGTKYLTYAVALALTIPSAWRARRKAARPEAKLPWMRKEICLNVIWESAQARPFLRQDHGLAFELLLARPVAGRQAYDLILDANPGLTRAFPQLRERHAPFAVEGARANLLGRALGAFVRRRFARRVLEGACYHAVRALHAAVRWHRRKHPDARHHVERMESYKHPYAILDRPGRPAPPHRQGGGVPVSRAARVAPPGAAARSPIRPVAAGTEMRAEIQRPGGPA